MLVTLLPSPFQASKSTFDVSHTVLSFFICLLLLQWQKGPCVLGLKSLRSTYANNVGCFPYFKVYNVNHIWNTPPIQYKLAQSQVLDMGTMLSSWGRAYHFLLDLGSSKWSQDKTQLAADEWFWELTCFSSLLSIWQRSKAKLLVRWQTDI